MSKFVGEGKRKIKGCDMKQLFPWAQNLAIDKQVQPYCSNAQTTMPLAEDNKSNGTTIAANSQNFPHANFSKTMKVFGVVYGV